MSAHRSFSGNLDRWTEFKFKLENYLAIVDRDYVTELEQLWTLTDPIAIGDYYSMAMGERSNLLYNMLASLCEGKASLMVQAVPHRNGFEVLRLLRNDCEPDIGSRQLGILNNLMEARVLDGATLDSFEERLLLWEAEVLKYELLTKQQLSQDLKKAVLLKKAPGEISEICVRKLTLFPHMRP